MRVRGTKIWIGLLTVIAAAALCGQAFASAPASVSLLGASYDGYGGFTISVADSRPGSKLVLFVSDGESRKAVVGRHRRATFPEVELIGIGKVSFAEVRTGPRGRHSLLHLRYWRYFDAVEEHVAFSTTEPLPVEPPKVEPPKVEAPTPSPFPPPAPVQPVCGNGTYVNSAGETVCKPEQSPTGPPPGATARCRDGTYSFSKSRSGTCSSHGGVAEWLY
jgi:hypothetical protein